MSDRRYFLKSAALGGATAVTGLFPRRLYSKETSGANPIVHRELGSTGYKVSMVSFGAMNTRDAELIHAAIDAGINYIDTAHGYMNGVNEEIVGQVLKNKRDKVFITTKIGRRDPEKIPDMIDISLKRLKTDHVDLLLLHSPSRRDQILNDNFMKIFDDARKQGKTRFIGFSTHSNHTECMELAVESKFWEAVCVGYNYQSPPELTKSIQKAREAGIAIIAMKTQLRGKGYPDKSTENVNSQQAALKWVLQNPNVDTAIPGVTSFEQLSENLAVMGMKMSLNNHCTPERCEECIDNSYCRGVAGCTACMDKCPKGVKVSEINRCLSYAYGYNNLELARENYEALPRSNRLDICAECDECVVKCTNGLNLTENIKRARSLFA